MTVFLIGVNCESSQLLGRASFSGEPPPCAEVCVNGRTLIVSIRVKVNRSAQMTECSDKEQTININFNFYILNDIRQSFWVCTVLEGKKENSSLETNQPVSDGPLM